MKIKKVGVIRPPKLSVNVKCERCGTKCTLDNFGSDLVVIEKHHAFVYNNKGYDLDVQEFYWTCPVCKSGMKIKSSLKKMKIKKYMRLRKKV